MKTEIKKYIFRIYTKNDPDDGYSEWTTASSKAEAEDKIRQSNPRATRIDLLSISDLQ